MNTPLNYTAQTESALTHLVAHGDQEAFAELYERLSGGLFSFAYLILFDREESELVVQEVFIAIWKNAPSFGENYGQMLKWATIVTRYKACELAQAHKNKHGGVDEETSDASIFEHEFIPTPLIAPRTAPINFQSTELI